MRILLTGKDGQLGFELQRALAPLGKVISAGRFECDMSNERLVDSLVRLVQPQIIVNAAAYTAVDKAEEDAETAFAVNAQAAAALARGAAEHNALLVHFSTDYVFDGTKEGRYAEDDKPSPQSVYGKSKLEGEQLIRQLHAKHLIFRTSWVFGSHGNNFAKTMLRLAAEKDALNVVADQHGAPTSASLLADVTAHVIREYQQSGPEHFPFGTYHVSASGDTSWFEYARLVLSEAALARKPLRVTASQVRPLATSEYPTPAKRPANSRLDLRKFERTFGLRLPSWDDGVRHVLKQIF